MSYLMGKLLALQRLQAAFEQMVREAPDLLLPRADSARISQLLPWATLSDLRTLLEQARDPVWSLDSMSQATAVVSELLREPIAARALTDYPLDSPKLLGAARAHGIDERVLAQVEEEMNRQGSYRK